MLYASADARVHEPLIYQRCDCGTDQELRSPQVLTTAFFVSLGIRQFDDSVAHSIPDTFKHFHLDDEPFIRSRRRPRPLLHFVRRPYSPRSWSARHHRDYSFVSAWTRVKMPSS